jgi:uncharacterized pyridoxal phosphate-containing UPF0001 family protein
MNKNGSKNGNGSTSKSGAKRLTFKEIEKHHDHEWVLLGDLDTDKYMRIKSAIVLAHSPDHKRVAKEAIKLSPKPKRGAFIWIGEMPNFIAVV